MTKDKRQILILLFALVVSILLFLFYELGSSWMFTLRLRSVKIVAMLIVSCCIAYSTVSFQTLTNNRILTPSIMGFESVYLLFQTVLVFIYGDMTYSVLNHVDNFILSIFGMIAFAMLLYVLIYKRGKDNLYLLLLIGLVLGILFNNLSGFMQLLIDPNDFFIVQGKMFASFNKINQELLGYASVMMFLVLLIGFKLTKYLDVLALGRDQSINLGLNYNRMVQLFLIIIAILSAISTALVGPITFLGLLVSNLTYETFRTHKHRVVIIACSLISAVTLIGGQFVMERFFNLLIPISTVVNFGGGIYFLYLLLRAKRL
ncbi:iron chelate uptake ABC transporter family permease subunit [Dysgonomonas sp. Marseille-P4677]|nr:iron chelate uptake ABC transporter family permease subunit [Dysgonomonas sp. Marseille-P4677]